MYPSTTVITVALLTSLLALSACKSTSSDLPDEITLPDGVEVVALELEEGEAGELPSGGRKFTVTAKLNKAVPAGEYAIIAYVVRDVELIGGRPLCAGFVGMTNSDGTSATRSASFELHCNDGKVAGRAVGSLYGIDEYDDSSGERSTKVYVQHILGIKTFLGMPVGVEGVKSNKIRVSCPR